MLLKVKVVPQSSRLEAAGWSDEILRIKLTKGAHDGEANEQLIAFLAKSFHLPKSSLTIVSGAHQREKVVDLPGIELETVKIRFP